MLYKNNPKTYIESFVGWQFRRSLCQKKLVGRFRFWIQANERLQASPVVPSPATLFGGQRCPDLLDLGPHPFFLFWSHELVPFW